MRPNGRVEVLSRTRDRASRAIEKKKPRATKSDLLRAIAKILQRHTSFLAQVRTDLPKTKASFAEFDGLYAAQTRELIEAGRLWLKLRPRRPWLVFEDVLWWWNDTGLHPLVPVEVIGVEPGKEHVNHYGPMEVHRAD